MADVLVVENVVKTFGALRAVDGVSLSVREGEVFGVAGPNGSGKSTLFNIITGIPFHADSGRILFDGTPIERMPPHAICRAGIARTFQTETDFETLSLFDNVKLGTVYGHARGMSEEEQRRVTRETLEFVGLGGDHDRPAGDISVFDKKRLMIASALATKPRLLLLDEPASGLTRPEIRETSALIRRLSETGVTIVLIEHVLPLLLTVSNRLMVLNFGQVLTEGHPKEVVKNEQVIEAYLGKRGDHGRDAA
ncbi:MAG: ABC transporter ATP-binding protein [Alphaproteobacteria bacterium]|nr:ABC transporter ATP-binding protein [Alphaproteobacteria bacterium]